MNKSLIGLIAGIFLFIVVIALARQVGGIAIRSIPPRLIGSMTATEPVVPGVPTVVEWRLPTSVAVGKGELLLRSDAADTHLATVYLPAGRAAVVFPCSLPPTVYVVLYALATGQVMAQQAVSLLPPGIDCALQR